MRASLSNSLPPSMSRTTYSPGVAVETSPINQLSQPQQMKLVKLMQVEVELSKMARDVEKLMGISAQHGLKIKELVVGMANSVSQVEFMSAITTTRFQNLNVVKAMHQAEQNRASEQEALHTVETRPVTSMNQERESEKDNLRAQVTALENELYNLTFKEGMERGKLENELRAARKETQDVKGQLMALEAKLEKFAEAVQQQSGINTNVSFIDPSIRRQSELARDSRRRSTFLLQFPPVAEGHGSPQPGRIAEEPGESHDINNPIREENEDSDPDTSVPETESRVNPSGNTTDNNIASAGSGPAIDESAPTYRHEKDKEETAMGRRRQTQVPAKQAKREEPSTSSGKSQDQMVPAQAAEPVVVGHQNGSGSTPTSNSPKPPSNTHAKSPTVPSQSASNSVVTQPIVQTVTVQQKVGMTEDEKKALVREVATKVRIWMNVQQTVEEVGEQVVESALQGMRKRNKEVDNSPIAVKEREMEAWKHQTEGTLQQTVAATEYVRAQLQRAMQQISYQQDEIQQQQVLIDDLQSLVQQQQEQLQGRPARRKSTRAASFGGRASILIQSRAPSSGAEEKPEAVETLRESHSRAPSVSMTRSNSIRRSRNCISRASSIMKEAIAVASASSTDTAESPAPLISSTPVKSTSFLAGQIPETVPEDKHTTTRSTPSKSPSIHRTASTETRDVKRAASIGARRAGSKDPAKNRGLPDEIAAAVAAAAAAAQEESRPSTAVTWSDMDRPQSAPKEGVQTPIPTCLPPPLEPPPSRHQTPGLSSSLESGSVSENQSLDSSDILDGQSLFEAPSLLDPLSPHAVIGSERSSPVPSMFQVPASSSPTVPGNRKSSSGLNPIIPDSAAVAKLCAELNDRFGAIDSHALHHTEQLNILLQATQSHHAELWELQNQFLQLSQSMQQGDSGQPPGMTSLGPMQATVERLLERQETHEENIERLRDMVQQQQRDHQQLVLRVPSRAQSVRAATNIRSRPQPDLALQDPSLVTQVHEVDGSVGDDAGKSGANAGGVEGNRPLIVSRQVPTRPNSHRPATGVIFDDSHQQARDILSRLNGNNQQPHTDLEFNDSSLQDEGINNDDVLFERVLLKKQLKKYEVMMEDLAAQQRVLLSEQADLVDQIKRRTLLRSRTGRGNSSQNDHTDNFNAATIGTVLPQLDRSPSPPPNMRKDASPPRQQQQLMPGGMALENSADGIPILRNVHFQKLQREVFSLRYALMEALQVLEQQQQHQVQKDYEFDVQRRELEKASKPPAFVVSSAAQSHHLSGAAAGVPNNSLVQVSSPTKVSASMVPSLINGRHLMREPLHVMADGSSAALADVDRRLLAEVRPSREHHGSQHALEDKQFGRRPLQNDAGPPTVSRHHRLQQQHSPRAQQKSNNMHAHRWVTHQLHQHQQQPQPLAGVLEGHSMSTLSQSAAPFEDEDDFDLDPPVAETASGGRHIWEQDFGDTYFSLKKYDPSSNDEHLEYSGRQQQQQQHGGKEVMRFHPQPPTGDFNLTGQSAGNLRNTLGKSKNNNSNSQQQQGGAKSTAASRSAAVASLLATMKAEQAAASASKVHVPMPQVAQVSRSALSSAGDEHHR